MMVDNGKTRFQTLLTHIPPTEQLMLPFQQGEIVQLEVDLQNKSWTFYFRFDNLLPFSHLSHWITSLKQYFSQLAEVEAYITYINPPTIEEAVEGLWLGLLQHLKMEWPSFSAGYYSEFKPRIEQNQLFFPALNGTTLDFLKSRHAEEVIQSFFKRWTGENFEITLELVEEAKSLHEAFIKDRDAEDLERSMQVAREEAKAQVNVEHKNGVEASNEPLTYGYSINDEIIPLTSITEEERRVAVQGTIFALEFRELRSGSTLVLFKITDFTSSIQVKVFARGKEDLQKLEKLKKGMWVKVRGGVQEDPFVRDLVLQGNDINEVRLAEKLDESEEKRVELHLHTNMSTMDANLPVSKAIERAARWEHPAIAITDHGGVQAFPEAYATGKKLGVKVIYGMEAFIVDDGVSIVYNPAERTLLDDTYVVFDVETTGLSATYDTIIELAAVKMHQGEIIERFERFANPHRPLSAKIIELTSITDDMLVDAPEVEQVLEEFKDFMGDSVLVAHNARFDMGFLQVGFNNYNLGEITNPVIDTLELARNVVTGLRNYRLNTLCNHYKIELLNHHRAVYDAEATGYLLWNLIKEVIEKGCTNLDRLNEQRDVSDLHRQRPFHATILATNATGLKNLYKLISRSYLEYFFRTPRIPKSELAQYREGLLIGSACDQGEVFEAAMQKSEEDLEEIVKFYDYLEIQPPSSYEHLIEKGFIQSEQSLYEIINKIIRVGEQNEKVVVATGNVHYLDKEDQVYRRILIKSQNGPKTRDPDNLAPQHFRTTEEMLAEFSFLSPEKAYEIVVKNTNHIANMIEELKPFPDKLYTPIIEGSDEEIRNMSYESAYQIYGNPLPDLVVERLEKELNSIINNGFAVIYLISHKLVDKSLEDGYLVGSRGSVGSSLVATMTRITEVNPLPPHYVCPSCKWSEFYTDGSIGSGFDLPERSCPNCNDDLKKDGHDIPFETFMGFEGDKVPDIDLNFSGEYQPRAHKYTEELFGSEFVFRAGTISTVAEKTAYGYVRKVLEEEGRIVRNAEVERLLLGCTGVKRTTGQHPGGLIVIPQYMDVHDFTPIQHPADDSKSGTITTHFDYHAISDSLLKLDILGHDDPTAIRMLQDLTKVDPLTINITDPDVMKLFSGTESLGSNLGLEEIGCHTGTLGIPEFGTRFVRQMLEETKPSTFAELVQISGLSHGTDVWLNNAQELIKNKVAELKDVIGCRDDIMVYLIHQGLEPARAFKIMEMVRRGRGITDEDQVYMREHNVPAWYIESCLRIKYMFPKAHAAAYVLMALRIAYFKVHYPIHFYATYFSVRADDFDIFLAIQGAEVVKQKIKEINEKGNEATPKERSLLTVFEICFEMLQRGFKFHQVDLYRSHSSHFIVEDDGLLPPLNAIPGVGTNAALNIVNAREEREFLSKEDLQQRTRISKTVLELLDQYGCLGDLPDSNQLSLFSF